MLNVLLIAILSFSDGYATVPQKGTHENAEPCLAIWRTGGMQLHPNQGLEMAVWPDGAILLSPRREALGEGVLVGKIDPNDITLALRRVRENGFHNLKRDWCVPDSAYTSILVRDAKTAEHRWHEFLLPGFGGDLNTDAEYRAFVRAWKQTRAAVESLAPIEIRSLGPNEDFRGYVAASPEKTAWRPD
jgi:hypothetical protein